MNCDHGATQRITVHDGTTVISVNHRLLVLVCSASTFFSFSWQILKPVCDPRQRSHLESYYITFDPHSLLHNPRVSELNVVTQLTKGVN